MRPRAPGSAAPDGSVQGQRFGVKRATTIISIATGSQLSIAGWKRH